MAELTADLAAGAVAIVSVHPSIRSAPAPPPERGGHLVLALGVRADEIVFHNPSGDVRATQAEVTLPVDVFGQYFTHRGIVFPSAAIRSADAG